MRRADIEVPNTPVDVNSWGVSACYPRGSFYPLSDGPSTRNHRITKPDFRPCSTCLSRSQAPFCLCTLRAISVRAEGTFGRLRYSLGGDRPSQTARLALSQYRITLQRRISIPSCSEAPRGLSVLLRVTGIFTGTTISPSLLLRQCPDHYAFRAGRNLPDKEFRYLRTVIVTAAVYRGLSSVLLRR